MKNAFWLLSSADDQGRLADWADSVTTETIYCSSNSKHQRSGRRTEKLSIILNSEADNFVWTWNSECIIRDDTHKLFLDEGFTGMNVSPIHATYINNLRAPPKLWELSPIGWAGIADPRSGIYFDPIRSCLDCGLLVYSGLSDSEHIIDSHQWDGSDFFIVWPLPMFIFVTDRVARFIQDKKLTGVTLTAAELLKFERPIFSPGRLSYYMPEERARELGETIGIY